MCPETAGTAPAGGSWHTAEQGDGVESIAHRFGHFWQTLWDHPQNQQLRSLRKKPNVLLPGDRVFVPEKRDKSESAATEQRHRFRRKGVPDELNVVVAREGKPRAGERYVLDIDGTLTEGTTDGEGRIRVPMSPAARSGKITVGTPPDADEFLLDLGGLDPATETSGLQGRLNNIGYDCGPADGVMTPETVAAIKAFQADAGLEATGTPDAATRDALAEKHGS